MERKKKQIENTKQKSKKKQIENTKKKKESNPGQPHGSLLYPPLYHSCKHVRRSVKLYTESNFSITMDTVKVFLKIC